MENSLPLPCQPVSTLSLCRQPDEMSSQQKSMTVEEAVMLVDYKTME